MTFHYKIKVGLVVREHFHPNGPQSDLGSLLSLEGKKPHVSIKKFISHDSKIEVVQLLLTVQGSGSGFVWVP